MDIDQHKHLSVTDWLITLILLAIPIVNIILYIVWAFSDSTHPCKRNFCRATLLLFVIVFGLSFVFIALVGGIAAVSQPS